MLSIKETFTAWLISVALFIMTTSQLFAQDNLFNANEIRSFQATFLTGRGVQVSWETKFNDTTSYFIIERSIDGLEFDAIGEVRSNNTQTNFRFIDRNPLPDVSYYRLQVVDYDGRSYRSGLISHYIPTSGKPELVLYPMPVGNIGTLNLNFKGVEQNFKALVVITDQMGRQVFSREMDINSFNTQGTVDLNGQLEAGNYQVTVLGHSGQNFRIGKLLQIVK